MLRPPSTRIKPITNSHISVVMSTAATPQSTTSYLNMSWAPGVVDKNASYYIYMHFAEVKEVITSRSRKLTVTINGDLIDKPFDPVYLKTTTKNTTIAADVGAYYFTIYSPDAIYKPILNAYEIYKKKEFLVSETNQQDGTYFFLALSLFQCFQ